MNIQRTNRPFRTALVLLATAVTFTASAGIASAAPVEKATNPVPSPAAPVLQLDEVSNQTTVVGRQVSVTGQSGRKIALNAPGTAIAVHGASSQELKSVSTEVTSETPVAATELPGAKVTTFDTKTGFQTLITITDKTASPTYGFALELPVSTHAELEADGSVLITDNDGFAVGGVFKPWAKDANGKSVPTHYSLANGVLTQTIDFTPETAFPVVADPQLEWEPFPVVYLNRSETKDASSVGGMAIVCGAIGLTIAATGPVAAGWLGVCAAAIAAISTKAGWAYNHGNCVKISITPPVAFEVLRSDKHCR
jgi:hypothetical protein